MKTRIIILLLIFPALNSLNALYAQESGRKMTIEGNVMLVDNGEKYAVANAVILLDGKKTGIVTNNQGVYKIRVRKETDRIGVYSSGIGVLEESIKGRNKIDFTYNSAASAELIGEADDGAVDIGYQEVNERDLVTPVGKIDAGKLKNVHFNNIYEMIRGQVPGVEVNGSSIRIRSMVSMGTGSEPLLVVNGVPVNTIGNIDPQMVKSIEVLKGASASIYGTRGANGVILVNLRK